MLLVKKFILHQKVAKVKQIKSLNPREMETTKIVNGVPTNILSYGKHIDENLDDVQDIFLLFPGRFWNEMKSEL